MPTRSASAKWEGGLKGGRGSFSGATGLAGQYNFSSRFENGQGSNPEELLAAAEAACYSMALSGGLEKNGTPPTSIETTARCTIEKVGEGFT
ncbi:MAG TPA: OsmC family peroxiredoxin, partial [Gemmatimonadaceae bacterium]|nr:OsmC family peroxiredoxin [Gemmatimonadaceae bacterium]